MSNPTTKKKEDDDKIRRRFSDDPGLLPPQQMSTSFSPSNNESSSSDESVASLYTPSDDRLEYAIKKSSQRKKKSSSAVNLRRNHSIHSRNSRPLVGWQLCKSGRFKARVFYNGKVIQFGNFLLKADAARMYDTVRTFIEEECNEKNKTRHMARNFYTEQEYIETRTGELMEIARTSSETLGKLLIESKPDFLEEEEILNRLNKPRVKVEMDNNRPILIVPPKDHAADDTPAAVIIPETPNQLSEAYIADAVVTTADDRPEVDEASLQQVPFNDGPSQASKLEQDQSLLSLESIQKQRLCDVIMACDTPRASRYRLNRPIPIAPQKDDVADDTPPAAITSIPGTSNQSSEAHVAMDVVVTPEKSIDFGSIEMTTPSTLLTENVFASLSPLNNESKTTNNSSELARLDISFSSHPSPQLDNISKSSEIENNEASLDSFREEEEEDTKLPADDESQLEKAVVHQVSFNVEMPSVLGSDRHDQECLSLEDVQEPGRSDQITANDRSEVDEASLHQVSFNDGHLSASKQEQDQALLSLEGIQEQRLCDIIMACDTPRASRSRSKEIPYSETVLSRNNIDYSFWQTFSDREYAKPAISSSHLRHCSNDVDFDSDDSLRDAYDILMGGNCGESYSSDSDLSDTSSSDGSDLDQDDYSIGVFEANETCQSNQGTNKRKYVPSASNFKAKRVNRKMNKNNSSRRRTKQKRKYSTKRKTSNPTKRRTPVPRRKLETDSPFFPEPSFRVGSQQGGHSCYPLNPRDKNHSMWVHIMDTSLLYFERTGNEKLSKIHRDHTGEYILVSRKEVENKGSYLFGPRNKFEYMFVQQNVTSESPYSNISIVELLESLGDFAKLSTRKVVSRLELFQSPAHQLGVEEGKKKYLIREFDSSLVEEIEDDGHEGCGYISESFLSFLFNKESAKTIISLQVRLFIPTKGIFKGMLMKQRNAKSSIILPTSMKKVDKSKKPRNNNACIVVCKAGVDPSKNTKQIAKLPHVDKDASGPAKSFEVKRLSKMLIRLLVAIGVPRKVVDRYVQRSAFRSHEQEKQGKFHLHHAFVRGVSDPTSNRAMEPNTVFISGISNSPKPFPDAILITRSPCIKATDIHLVNIVKIKPERMSSEDYEWLCELPFGAVIFAFPRKGCHTMPSAIAKGDLDGDRYFIIWDEEILKHSKAPLLVDKILSTDEKDENTKEVIDDPDWFTKAQEFMVHPDTGLVGALVGKLYKASEKAADDDKGKSMMNEDAMAFADAYYDALEN